MTVAERFQGANVVDAGRLSPYWGEHAARYGFALAYCDGKTVLDIACGTGYGLGILKSAATFIVGVDVDPAALADAKLEGQVALADGLHLPFASRSFDVVTSFETLEHVNDRPAFLRELKRVLRIDGVLILSTPNADYTQPKNGKPSNPFHIHEYRPDDLQRELSSVFSIEGLFGQLLDPDFGIPPFFDAQQRLPKDLSTRLRLTGWRAVNKLPASARDAVSRSLWQRSFYPSERDYQFMERITPDTPVIVAVCRRPK